MKRAWILIAFAVLVVGLAAVKPQASPNNDSSANAPMYTQDGNLKFPTNYREWVYVTSGVDMSYGPGADMGHSMFDNVCKSGGLQRIFADRHVARQNHAGAGSAHGGEQRVD